MTLGLLAALVASPAHAAFPGANGEIAFTSARDGDDEIYVMNPDGSRQTRLTGDPAADGAPAFSRDGSRIAFQSTRVGFNEIFAMSADGSGETNLTSLGGDDLEPSFSPSGRIAYSRNAGGNYEIFAMNADGSAQTNLTNTPAVGELAPAFSPDGSRIAFTRGFDILVMNADGTGQTSLTSTAAAETDATFSPDGAKIAFESNRDGDFEIYVMNADGSGQTRLTSDPAGDTSPAFSPDGAHIAFTSDRSGDEEIWVMGADGSSPVNVSQRAGVGDSRPDWAVLTRAPASVAPPPSAAATTTPTAGGGTAAPPPSTASTAAAPPPGAAAALAAARAQAARPTGAGSASHARRAGTRTPTRAAPAAPARRAQTGARPPAAALAPGDVEPSANPRRANLSAFLVRPGDLYLSAADIQRSVAIGVLLLLLLGLPARIFNATMTANRAELAAWFAPVRAAFAAITPSIAQRLLGIAGVSAVFATTIYVFLDPEFPNKPGALPFALGMLMAFGVIVALQLVTWRRYIDRHQPDAAGGWSVYPGQVALSIACVAVSRLAHFVPGLVFGMAGGYQPRRPLDRVHAGRRIVLTYGLLLAVSLAAWVASIPVAAAAERDTASALVLTLDAALAVLALGGMQTVVFGLVPLMFLDGDDVYRWRKGIWLGLWSIGLLWLAVVVINPALSHQQGDEASLAWLGGLLAFQMIVALGLWSFFVARRRRAWRPAAGRGHA